MEWEWVVKATILAQVYVSEVVVLFVVAALEVGVGEVAVVPRQQQHTIRGRSRHLQVGRAVAVP
jgi:hypothetical protein